MAELARALLAGVLGVKHRHATCETGISAKRFKARLNQDSVLRIIDHEIQM